MTSALSELDELKIYFDCFVVSKMGKKKSCCLNFFKNLLFHFSSFISGVSGEEKVFLI